jgi:hypothetical protein
MLPDTDFQSYFLTVFGRPAATTACECERETDANLAQSLHLLNSKQMQEKLSDERGVAKAYSDQLAEIEPQPDSSLNPVLLSQISEIYQRALSRGPRPEELVQASEYLQQQPDYRVAYEDVLWAIINSKEFLFNH